jgi:hypothetical protein
VREGNVGGKETRKKMYQNDGRPKEIEEKMKGRHKKYMSN